MVFLDDLPGADAAAGALLGWEFSPIITSAMFIVC